MEKYTLGPELGRGAFGVAFKATERSTGQCFALKKLDKSHSQFKRDDVLREIAIMQKVQGPHTIRFFEHWEDDASFYLVLELCTGGELMDRMFAKADVGQTYSEKDASEVLIQCMRAVRSLHAQYVAHCDIKPENFLFSSSDATSPLKMIDFGLSYPCSSGVRQPIVRFGGTPDYMAPEQVDKRFGMPADVWSVGVVMFMMLYGYNPFSAYDQSHAAVCALVRQGFHAELRPGYGPWFNADIPVSASARELMAKLLCFDAAVRQSILFTPVLLCCVGYCS